MAVRRAMFQLNDAPFPLDYARGNYASALRAKTLCLSDELSAGAIRQVQRHISKFIFLIIAVLNLICRFLTISTHLRLLLNASKKT
jgi:hypothetical protein